MYQPTISGNHPLRGINDDALGPRFPSITDAYDVKLQNMVLDAAKALKLDYKVRPNGTYCFVSGPCYESKAESKFLRSIGGDSVGMSTVPEVIAAKHCGMQILGLSLVTNKAVVDDVHTVAATHQEVLEAVEASGVHVEALVKHIINKKVIGSYLAAQPEFTYSPKPNAHAAVAATSPAQSGACCPVSGQCPKKECCVGAHTGLALAIAAVAAGLFYLAKVHHNHK